MADINTGLNPLNYIYSAISDNSTIDLSYLDGYVTEQGDSFAQITINESNWNQTFPYKLQIVDSNDKYSVYQKYSFTLPIPPQDLTISMPFAINVIPTFGGISEEHAGAPFRTIVLNGTTGISPQKRTSFGPRKLDLAQTIFAGTLTGASATGQQLQALFGQVTPPDNVQNKLGSGLDDLPLTSTGYYQYLLLVKFLEFYSFLKKKSAHRNLRLAFCQYKTDEMYIVTPISLISKRDISSPQEYKYTLQLKAWKRIPINGETSFENINVKGKHISRTQNALARVLQKLQESRSTLQDLGSVIGGFNSDVESVLFEPLREAAMFVKDSIGITITASDLPKNLIKELKLSVIDAWASIGDDINFLELSSSEGRQLKDSFNKASTISESSMALSSSTVNNLNNTDPLNDVFNNPDKYRSFFEQITPTSLKISNVLISAIEAEKDRIRKLTRIDFENRRIAIEKLAASISNVMGMGSSTYNNTYSVPDASITRIPTDDTYDILFHLNEVCVMFDKIAAAFINTSNDSTPEAIEYVAGLANASGIAFTKPVSKFPVPFPYGASLERLAAQYLKDPNRWMEIAVLNGLREPFVDETGFDIPLISNGNGNKVIVASATNLYLGQVVYIYSNSVYRQKRHILNIYKAGNSYILTLDGDATLDVFRTVDSAKIHAYLPGTVNSQMMIYIPSENQATSSDSTQIPGINDFDNLLNISGVDLLLTPDGDLAITPNGNTKLAYGMNNLVQAVKLAISTPRGSLLQHPDYGMGIVAGTSTADVDAKDVLKMALNLFNNDPRFSKVLGASVSKIGQTISINITVQVAGTNQLLPVSIDIKN